MAVNNFGDWYIVYGKMTQYYLALPSKTYDTHICVFAEDESDAICIGTHYFIQKEKAKEEADKYFDWSS